jgi:hypothetical protein
MDLLLFLFTSLVWAKSIHLLGLNHMCSAQNPDSPCGEYYLRVATVSN